MQENVTRESARRILEVNPSLSYAEVGRLLGVSRERIRQVVGKRRRFPKSCRVCGSQIFARQKGVTGTAYRQRYCAECWASEKQRRRAAGEVPFVCEICGKTFWIRASAVRRKQKIGQRIRWCSKKCQGRWLAANYGDKHARALKSAAV